MFIKTFKLTKKTAVIALAALAVILALIIILAGGGNEESSAARLGGMRSTEDRTAYLEELGWTVDADSEQAQAVVIPREFSAAYESYNALQTAQGFDLAQFKGMQVTVYTYTVTNYTGSDDCVEARLYIYKNRVIGGDVHSTALDGFMHGLK